MSAGRKSAAGWLVGALLLAGCATPMGRVFPGGEEEEREPTSAELARPDAPPEYDVLVAQQLILDGRSADAVDAYLRAVAKDPGSPWLRRRAAVALAQHNRLGEALQQAQEAVDLAPDEPESRLFLAQLYRIQRQPEQAVDVLVGPDGEPENVEAAFLLYQLYLEQGDTERALEAARFVAREDGDSLRGHVAIAQVYQRMGEPERAEAALRDALAEDPGNLRLYDALARLLRQRGAHDEEIEVYDQILGLYPYHHGTLVALGEARLALEDVPGAIAVFEQVEERYPEDLQSAVRLGYLLFEDQRYDDAQERFERVLASSPEEYEVAFFLGVVKRRVGRTEEALRLFRSVPEDHRYYPEARTQLASVLERRGLYSEALAEVERAADARGGRDLELYAATLEAKAGQLDRAVDRVEAMLAEDPESDELLFNLGVVYGEAKRTEQAIEYMREALERNPDNASALNYIGYTWAEQGENLDQAEAMIRRAIALRPEDGFIVDSLGWVYYMRARPLIESGRAAEAQPLIEAALEQLYRAHELTGGDPVISEHLGDTYLLLDQKEEALEKFEEAVRLEPREGEQPDLHDKLESLQRELR